MSWQKSSDTAATHPRFMQIIALPGCDERTTNEVAGWLWRCSVQSAQHRTDYFVDVGTAHMLGLSRTPELVKIAKRAGLLTETKVDGVKCYKLIDDEALWHIRSRAEQEWDNQQRNDTRDPAIKVPVVRRDGDNCRWCGVLTQWRGQRSRRTFTLDHLVPGQAGTPDTMVVACWGCQSSRKDNPQWDDDHPLRPEPTPDRRLYGRWSALFLTENGYPTEQNVYRDDQRPAPAQAADPAPYGVRPAPAAAADPAGARETAPRVESDSSLSPPATTTRVGRAGSGRDGTGSGPGSGSGRDGPGQGGSGRPRRRGRRGGRGAGSTS